MKKEKKERESVGVELRVNLDKNQRGCRGGGSGGGKEF